MRSLRLACAGLLALAACGGDDGPGTIDARPIDAPDPDAMELPDPLPTGPVRGEFLTFNIGMIQTVLGAQARLPHVIQAVRDADVDVVCFQEVYTQYTDPSDVAEELADVYPHAVWEDFNVNNLSNGLLIVSKAPLYRKRFLRYTMNDPIGVVDRAVLAATVVADDWYTHVLCTHIQAGLDETNTNRRRDQLRELGEFVNEHGYADGPAILLGDFNAGPEAAPKGETCPIMNCGASCLPVDTESITMMRTTYGWTDQAAELGFSDCTYCKLEAEALAYPVNLFPCEGSQRIDHCFHRGLGASRITAMTRTMDQAVSIACPTSPDPDRVCETLSDHFAVQCTVGP